MPADESGESASHSRRRAGLPLRSPENRVLDADVDRVAGVQRLVDSRRQIVLAVDDRLRVNGIDLQLHHRWTNTRTRPRQS